MSLIPQGNPTPAARALGRDEISAHLEANRAVYETIARNAGFSIGFGAETCFDHRTSTAVIGVEQLNGLGVFSSAEVDFIVLHELGHFKEFYEDPKGYLALIEECKARGEPLTSVYFDLFNSLADIYVNRNTRNVASQYEEQGEYTAEIKDLYREKAFATRDFTTRPFVHQYMDYVLNHGMGVSADIELSPKVREAIEQGVTLFGEHYSYKDFTETFLTPAIGKKRTNKWQASASERHLVINQAIIPVFERLLNLDQAAGRDLSRPGTFFGALDPDLGSIEAAASHAAEKARKENLSAEERAALERSRQAGALAAAAKMNPAAAQEFVRILEKVQPMVHELVEMFERIQKRQSDWRERSEGYSREGQTLDVEETIERFPKISMNPLTAEVMTRTRFEEHVEFLPKRLRLYLMPDLSGSMNDDISKLKEVVVALAAAMVTICVRERYGDSTLSAELGVVGYNGEEIPLIKPNPEKGVSLEDVAACFAKLKATGGTVEHLALRHIISERQSLPDSKPGDLLEILIGVTDGDTENPDESRNALSKLEAAGVKVGAIKIVRNVKLAPPPIPEGPGPDQMRDPNHGDSAPQIDSEKFDQIWNRQAQRGFRIRTAAELTNAVKALLAAILSPTEEENA